MSAPAGWYPDPADPRGQRWWDGVGWTAYQQEATATAPQQPQPRFGELAPTASYGVAAPVTPLAPPAPVNVDTNTVWIWLAVVVTALPFAMLFLFDWNGYMEAVIRAELNGEIAALQDWAGRILLLSLVSWGCYAGLVVLCWLDWRELRSRGVPAPFHWAWSFFAGINGGLAVYMIGRAVVLRRRTVGGGWAPLWVWIGVTVVGFIVAVVWSINIMTTTFAGISQFI
ncbi:MAG: hypothetical protein DI566_02635 [Microbacterium sp.]|nr:MAG: hypothetical protein DI566_02635 [Microbacterium sp.]